MNEEKIMASKNILAWHVRNKQKKNNNLSIMAKPHANSQKFPIVNVFKSSTEKRFHRPLEQKQEYKNDKFSKKQGKLNYW